MRSLPDILKKHPDAHVFIIGGDNKGYGMPPPEDNTWKNIFFNEIEEKTDVSKIHFLGTVDYKSLISLYQISSAHVYLTYPFVLSWSLLEAMSCGCLVIGSNTEPVKEVITDKSNGLLVDFFNQKEISNTINNVLENPKKYEKLKKAARTTIIKKYDSKMKNYNILLEKYNKGIESIDGLGRRGSESNYLINNSELWYMWALVIGILPAVPWLKEQQKQQEIDRELANKSYYSGEGANPEYYKPMATLGIKPGLIISIIGFLGSKIKLSDKEYFIKHEDIKKLKLFEILKSEEISLLIKIYNSWMIN